MRRSLVAGSSATALVLAGLWVRRVVLPKRPDDAPGPRIRRIPDPDARPAPDGDGVRIVVNPSSGPVWSPNPAPKLRAGLPAADVHELAPDDDLQSLLREEGFVAIGAAGGDGTLSAAAMIAADRDVPFVAVPAGTLNHLARDLGLDSVDDAVAAVRAGTVTHMDLAVAGDRCFVNTLSFGGYTALVDRREKLERHLGKWPALLVALVIELHRMRPLPLEVDGRRVDVWVGWIGNCAYAPDGFGPSWRERLDDGLLDVRLVHTGHFSRIRVIVDVFLGRLQRCPAYDECTLPSLTVKSLDGPLRLAADGETYDGPVEFEVTKRRRALQVAVPPPPPEEPSTT
ncbi:MAG: NAD(+)/NADH kinase [Acidimicrobiia bacterium]|nr:NAD(+)/NADH kinase [Acidimicrobiia bacterium]